MTNCRNFEDEIRLIYSNNRTRYSKIIRNDSELLSWLTNRCINFTDYLPEMVYSILHDDESPFCASGNKRKFRTITTGWNRCDDATCSDCISRSLDRARKTSMELYGVDNPMKDGNIKNKMVESARANDSYAVAAQKRREHYLNELGVDHPWKTVEGKQKFEKSMIARYGCINPSSSEKLSEKKRQNNLKKYGVEYPILLDIVRDRMKNTLLERYNVTNPSQIPEVQEKIANTSMKKYGVRHFTQSDDIIQKRQSTCIIKYGETNYNKTEESKKKQSKNRLDTFFDSLNYRVPTATPLFDREEYTGVHNGQKYKWLCKSCNGVFVDGLDDGRIPQCDQCYPSPKSKGEYELASFIESLGFDIVRNSRSIISPLELDMFVPEKKIAFEFNGVYFHSELSGGKDRNYHLQKYQMCADLGIQLVQVLDFEWNTTRDLVESRIKQKLGISNVIYARKCTVDVISSAAANKFNAINHIQSTCNGSINYGLFYDGDLISVMSFGRSRYNKLADYELLRFATIKHHTVVGGAAKLLTFFEREFNFPSIVSYCDLRWNSGAVYKKIGFKLYGYSKPNYLYHKHDGIFESRIKYQKHKLKHILNTFDDTLSEWQNMMNNGFDRIWDCGNAVFIKTDNSM